MDFGITNNYINYRKQDRRRSDITVEVDRRSGIDRRKQGFLDEINRLDNKAVKGALTVLSPIPTVRRVYSLPDEIEKQNYSRGAGLVGLAVANLPRDMEELGRACKNGLAKNPYQHEFSFFKGTFLKFLPTKFKSLQKSDKSLFNTKAGKFLQKTCGIGVDFTDIGEIKGVYPKTILDGYKYTGNFIQQTAGRALHRIPVIGLVISSLFEIPALIKSVTKTKGTVIDKTKAFTKQLVKSAGYIGLTTTGIAIGGALLFPHGAILGLAGMAIGSIVALAASKELNKKIDKLS